MSPSHGRAEQRQLTYSPGYIQGIQLQSLEKNKKGEQWQRLHGTQPLLQVPHTCWHLKGSEKFLPCRYLGTFNTFPYYVAAGPLFTVSLNVQISGVEYTLPGLLFDRMLQVEQILTGLPQCSPTPIATPTPPSLLSCPFTILCHIQGTYKATPEHPGRAGNKVRSSEWAVIVAGQGWGGGTDGEHSGFCATAYSRVTRVCWFVSYRWKLA